jgi:septum formation protein
MNTLLPVSAQQNLVLASASPRRRQLMEGMGYEFECLVSDYHEDSGDGESPAETVRRHALGKALAVAPLRPGCLVIGADTIVLADEILGKPRDRDQARRMLLSLAGREHQVLTAVALVGGADDGREIYRDIDLSSSRVRFRELDDLEIESYLGTGEPFDKAGAYGIQGTASQFITGITGCYFNVMGLPLELLLAMFRRRAVALDLVD